VEEIHSLREQYVSQAMQALADITLRSPRLLPEIRQHIAALSANGTPAMQARGRKLLKLLMNQYLQTT
jgi:hypothetical protein